MQIKELQTALIAKGFDLGPSGADGIPGKLTRKAVDDLLTQNKIKGNWQNWSDERRFIAAEQIIYESIGIEIGEVDGLVGTMTRYGRDVWDARQKNNGQPVPEVENWRDKVELGPTTQDLWSKPWPRQSGVPAFYGEVGKNQTSFELPFPFRIAWNPTQLIRKLTCHQKVAKPMERIWKRTLEHYGHEKIKQIRLDMYGGCLNVRKVRGGSTWSMHAWGIALDIDPERNQLKWGRDLASLDDPPYKDFWRFVYDEGAIGLGPERNYDWMHFQFARL